ncbi:MAG: alpha/beta hydrolase [Actinomycetota bacterium]|nr:alpha/beta hydrolase [Actinomycetota bacterium]
MATYVLVHGAWGGSWQFGRVAKRLRGAGHDVFTPTLTGQGDRAHLFSPEVGLDTHVRDVAAMLEYEDLSEVVLVAHSYGGMVATAAAEQAPGRLAQIVYIDAFVPTDGQSTLELFPPKFQELFRARARDHDGLRIPGGDFILDIWGVTDPAQREWVGARTAPFPIRCWEQPAKLPANAAAGLRRSFVDCTASLSEIFGPFAERARIEGWGYQQLASSHVAWLTHPETLAEIVLRLSESS